MTTRKAFMGIALLLLTGLPAAAQELSDKQKWIEQVDGGL